MVILGLWGLGCLWHIARFLTGHVGARWILSKADPIRNGREVEIAERARHALRLETRIQIVVTDVPVPMISGIVEPVVLLSFEAQEWSDEKLEAVFVHEFAHVKGRDLWWRPFVEFVNLIYWFNPIVYVLRGSYNLHCEMCCDDLVVLSKYPKVKYASHLLEVATGLHSDVVAVNAMPMTRTSEVGTRIKAILGDINRSPISIRQATGMVLLASVLIPLYATARPIRGAAASSVDVSRLGEVPPTASAAAARATLQVWSVRSSPTRIPMQTVSLTGKLSRGL